MNSVRMFANRPPRERRFILTGISVVVLLLLIQLAYTAHQQRERLRRQVPAMERQLAETRADADELKRIQAGATNRQKASGGELEKWLRLEAVQIGDMKVTLTGPRRASIKGEVDFERWTQWAARVHREQEIRIASADLKPGSQPGRVLLTADFAGADSQ